MRKEPDCPPVAILGFFENHFFIKSSTAAVIATMPVRIVGSGTGANLLECKVGSGGAPGFFDSRYFRRIDRADMKIDRRNRMVR